MPAGWTPGKTQQQIESLTHSRTPDETTIWSNVTHKGIIRRHTTQVMEITNYAVYLQREGQPTIRIPFISLSQVVALNAHYAGSGIHYTVGSGSYRSRSYMGVSSYSGHSVGDILFMSGTSVLLRFNGVNDAGGLARVCNGLIRQMNGIHNGMVYTFKN